MYMFIYQSSVQKIEETHETFRWTHFCAFFSVQSRTQLHFKTKSLFASAQLSLQ